MKIAVCLLFTLTSSLFAIESHSQIAKVTVVAGNVSTEKVIHEIEKQTNYLFVYNVNQVDLNRSVKAEFENQTVSDVLDQVFEDTNIYYAVEGSNIMLMSRSSEGQKAAQQQNRITGVVLDEFGESIIGANVQVKGQTTGTITDIDGRFILDAPVGSTIQISNIGYVTQEFTVDQRKEYKIVLREDNELLDEVVVVGYGTVKRRDVTGAVSSMKSKDVVISPTNNVMEALSGKIAGMDIVKTSGQVGEDVQILLRGSRSIYGDNTPLFIIDGIPGSYSQVNPSDIETIDVLKDASSTAIYGSAGANGVVIITTKRGTVGKATVNFDAYYGFSGKPEYFNGMIGDEWTDYQMEAYKYMNGQYPADMSAILTNADKLNAYNQGKWIDWVDEAAGNTATTQKYSMSVTGGSEKTKIFASASYTNEEGLISNDNMKRYAMRLNIDQEIFSWAKMGFSSNLTYTDRNRGVKNTFTKALSVFPLGDAYDANGDLNHEYAPNEYSPLGDFIPNQYVNNTKSTYINVNAYLEVSPVKGLNVKSVISPTLNNSRLGQFWGDKCNANRPTYAGTPHASITNSYGRGYTWENIATYNTTIAEKHSLGATFVTSWTHNQVESNMAAGSGQDLEAQSFWRLTSATAPHVESDFAQTQKMSYAARINYSYLGKYLFTVSTRWDGVSWLAKKWDSFPAAAVAWRISDEDFMKNTQSWLSNLKLRAGYGVTGNSGGIGAYGTTTNAVVYSSAGLSLGGLNSPFAQYTGTYSNPNLGWEKSYNWNVGIDFGLINNRIDGSIEWFNTKTKGLLFKRTLPVTTGNTGWGSPLAVWQNLAKTSNKGVEVTINSHNIVKKNFTWDTTLSFTWSSEKINSLPTGDLINEGLFEGQPIKTLYDYKYNGIWGTNTPQSVLDQYGVKPGWVMIETVAKDGDNGVHKYSTADRQILGHSNPDYIIGLNNSFTFMDFDLSVFVMGRYGQTIKSSLLGWYTANSSSSTNQPAGIDYWTENNQGAYFPVPGSGGQQSVMSALTYRDGSFIKVKNITLGYTLPRMISQKALMQRCRLYATAYNPFVYVKDKQLRGTDPETNGSDAFPLYKQFVFGVNITF